MSDDEIVAVVAGMTTLIKACEGLTPDALEKVLDIFRDIVRPPAPAVWTSPYRWTYTNTPGITYTSGTTFLGGSTTP